jgi:hypothetical protein
MVGTRQVRLRRGQWQRWQHDNSALAGISYDQLRAALRPGSAERVEQDRLLAALVRVARQDADAVAVLVECLRPGMAARVRQYGRGLDADDAWSILTLSLVEQIARYDTTRHHEFVARRLLWVPTRELKRAAVAAREQQARQVSLDDTSHLPSAGSPGPDLSAGHLLAAATEAGAISRPGARLLHHVRVHDEPIATAAARCGLGYEAAKKAVQRANRRWAAWWLATDRPSPQAPDHRSRPTHRHPTSSGDT